MKEQLNIVIVGHVDHGKSTIIGRLLADTNSLPEGKLEQVKAICEFNSKPFEYSFLLDTLKDERSQGITIDSARIFFKTEKRDFIIIDAPGHIEFLKNMISGASRAEAALLVIDAAEGIQENSRRHGYMLSMLGIKQVAVVINKMDLVNYNESVFQNITKEYEKFLKEIGLTPFGFIPVSGRDGENIISRNGRLKWFEGNTLIDILNNFNKGADQNHKPFRMPVQDIYKFTNDGDDRRIIAGNVESGEASVGEELIFYPSGKRSRIKSIEGFNIAEKIKISSGYSTGFTLEDQIYIKRGEIAVKANEKSINISDKIKVSLFWLGRSPFVKGKEYYFKLGTLKVSVKLHQILKIINASDLSILQNNDAINLHDVAECILTLGRPAAFDTVDNIASTSRFVIIDKYEISGGGIIREAIDDKYSQVRDKVVERNFKWEKSIVSGRARSEKYNQKSILMLFSGSKDSLKKEIAKKLETKLFADGKFVYFLGIGNLKYGVDADIKENENYREEHFRRLSEVSHLLMDAGLILIVTASDITNNDLEIMKTIVNPDKISTIWVGNDAPKELPLDLEFPGETAAEECVEIVVKKLEEKGIIFKP
jgi:bifunctional enzyme CysN/CysC